MRRLANTLVNLCIIKPHVLRAEGDVGIDRFLKKLILRVLEHQSHLAPDIFRCKLIGVYILAVNRHGTGAWLEQTV